MSKSKVHPFVEQEDNETKSIKILDLITRKQEAEIIRLRSLNANYIKENMEIINECKEIKKKCDKIIESLTKIDE